MSLKDQIISKYYEGHDAVIVPTALLPSDFLTLENGQAGELLQTLANFRMKVAFVGPLVHEGRTSQLAFLAEAERSAHYRFFATLEEAESWAPGAGVVG